MRPWDAPHWHRRPAPDIVVRRPPQSGVQIRVEILIDLLGERRVQRLRERQRRLGVRGALSGRWDRTDRGGYVLEVQAGTQPLARFLDRNTDRRLDTMYVWSSSR